MIIPEELIALGVRYKALEYYPRQNGVFADRYFNAALEEVAYQIRDISGEYKIFDPPRLWYDQYLEQLIWIPREAS